MKKNLSKKLRIIAILTILMTVNMVSIVNAGSLESPINISSNTITVDDSGGADYTSIQDAIDNASTGDTIKVFNGTYREHITIDKQLKLIGDMEDEKNRPVIDADEAEYAVIISADNCIFQGFKIINTSKLTYWYAGIKILSNNNILMNNSLSDHHNGIILWNSNNNIICNNNITHSIKGVHLIESSNNSIINNSFSEITYNGILVWYHSNNNTLSGNDIITTETLSTTIFMSESNNNKISNNKISTDIVYPGTEDDPVFNSGYNGIFLQYSSKNKIIGNDVSRYQTAIYLSDSNNNIIAENSLNSCFISGLVLSDSHLNYITNNNFINNSFWDFEKLFENYSFPPFLIWLIRAQCKPAFFVNSFFNKWHRNYWDDWLGIIPRPIKGKVGKYGVITWRNFDLFPRRKPYEPQHEQSSKQLTYYPFIKSTKMQTRLLEFLTRNTEFENAEEYSPQMLGINIYDFTNVINLLLYDYSNWI